MFKKAERVQTKLKLAIIGPSGSGKTKSSLRLATGFGAKKIAVIDCENGSASLYADQFDFDVAVMSPPFTTEKYQRAINEAVTQGYDFIIIDSISHAWAGTGGLMDQKETLDSSGKGSSYTNWKPITKKHEAFKDAFLQANAHVICTMRSKQDYILIEEKGKQVPKKVGMAPIQREGMEYEFTTVFDVNMNHDAEVSKDRTGMFSEIHQITEETGHKFRTWLESAKPAPEKPATAPPVTEQKAAVTTQPPAAPPAKPTTPPPAEKKNTSSLHPNVKNHAPASADTESIADYVDRPLSAMEKVELSKWVMPGGNFKGKKLGEVDQDSLLGYRQELLDLEKQGKKLLSGHMEIIKKIEQFYSDVI